MRLCAIRCQRCVGHEIPADGMVMLQRGGLHVMMMGIETPLKDGDAFPLTLVFENAGEGLNAIPAGDYVQQWGLADPPQLAYRQSGDVSRWTPKAEALLNYAARESHLVEIVRPALGRGAIVICDRFMDSTRAYQGAGKGIADADLCALHGHVTGNLWPDVTIVMTIDSAAEADLIFSMLMGDEVPPRRAFIESHAKFARIDV